MGHRLPHRVPVTPPFTPSHHSDADGSTSERGHGPAPSRLARGGNWCNATTAGGPARARAWRVAGGSPTGGAGLHTRDTAAGAAVAIHPRGHCVSRRPAVSVGGSAAYRGRLCRLLLSGGGRSPGGRRVHWQQPSPPRPSCPPCPRRTVSPSLPSRMPHSLFVGRVEGVQGRRKGGSGRVWTALQAPCGRSNVCSALPAALLRPHEPERSASRPMACSSIVYPSDGEGPGRLGDRPEACLAAAIHGLLL